MASDFLRALQGQLFVLAVYLLIIIASGLIILRIVRDAQIKKYVGWVVIVLVIAGILTVGIRAVHMATVNETRRNIIDRTDVNNDADSFKRNVEEGSK